MPELVSLILSTAAFVTAVSFGYMLYTRPPRYLRAILPALGSFNAELIGNTIRHAYPPSDVAGIINAVVEEQKPAMLNFLADEAIPALAAAGGGEVASNARLARSVKGLGSGASGLQGLMAMVAKPGKKSGIGEFMQYMPLIQQFLGSQAGQQGNGGDSLQPSGQPQQQSQSPPMLGKMS